MIRSMILSFVFILATTLSHQIALAAEKVDIRFAYLPKSVYLIEQSAEYDMTMKLENPFIAPEELRKKLPLSLDVRDRKIMSVSTEAMAEDRMFPITMELKKTDRIASTNGSFPQRMDTNLDKLVGLRVHGRSDDKGSLKFDRIEGKEVPEEYKTIIISVFEEIGKTFSRMESKPVGVGETFTQKIPLNIPIPGIANIGMEMTITYRLIRIVDRLAEFDTTSSFKFAASAESELASRIEATGEGTGTLSFDIDKKMAVKAASKCTMEMFIPVQNAKLVVTVKASDTSTTQIQGQGQPAGSAEKLPSL